MDLNGIEFAQNILDPGLDIVFNPSHLKSNGLKLCRFQQDGVLIFELDNTESGVYTDVNITGLTGKTGKLEENENFVLLIVPDNSLHTNIGIVYPKDFPLGQYLKDYASGL